MSKRYPEFAQFVLVVAVASVFAVAGACNDDSGGFGDAIGGGSSFDDDDADDGETVRPPSISLKVTPGTLDADGISIGRVTARIANVTFPEDRDVKVRFSTDAGTFENQRLRIEVPVNKRTGVAEAQLHASQEQGNYRVYVEAVAADPPLVAQVAVRLVAADSRYWNNDRGQLPTPGASSSDDDDDDDDAAATTDDDDDNDIFFGGIDASDDDDATETTTDSTSGGDGTDTGSDTGAGTL